MRRSRESVAGHFAHAAFWSVAGAVLARAGTLVAHVVVARALGAHEYGKFAVLTSTAMLVTPFAGLGLGLAVTKHVAQFRDIHPARAAAVIRSGLRWTWMGGLGGAGLVVVAAFPLATSALDSPDLESSLQLVALWIPFACASATQDGALVGLEAFRSVAVWSTVRGVVAAGALATGALAGGLNGAVIGLVIGEAVAVFIGNRVLSAQCARHGLDATGSEAHHQTNTVFRLALTNLLVGAAVVPAQWLPRVWLTRLPNGFAELGVFDAANKWAVAVGFIPAFITSAQLPLLSRLAGAGRHDDLRQLRSLHVVVATVASLVPGAVVALVADRIMKLNGTGYASGAPVLVILALSVIAVTFNMALGQDLVSRGHNRLRLLAGWVWAGALLGGALFLVPRHGAVGLAVAHALAYVCSSVAMGVGQWGANRVDAAGAATTRTSQDV